ncbi:hypothetical protein C2845_PM09G17270 [Panicum miliaceum]|uniref:Uncharacterized protein n=1 Tax=Panicum miliaceum TaxID=4540 RepID=A0A3L6RYU8_PANMI|nr:hypothetical protein C2845_PM09G17270 [Panicum miliaceum]
MAGAEGRRAGRAAGEDERGTSAGRAEMSVGQAPGGRTGTSRSPRRSTSAG